jgi:hypothetical protein
MRNSQIIDDQVMFALCKKIKNTPDEDVQIIADFIDVNKSKIDLNYFCKKTGNWAPIHFAAKQGKEKMLCMLIKNGADPFLPVGTIDEKLCLRETWKTGVTLAPENLQLHIKKLFLEQNKLYNENNKMLVLGEGLLLRIIAVHFIEDNQTFSNLYRTCKKTQFLLNDYMLKLKEIHDWKKQIEKNCSSMKYHSHHLSPSYNPFYDESGDVPYNDPSAMDKFLQEQENSLNKLEQDNIKLIEQIDIAKITLKNKIMA